MDIGYELHGYLSYLTCTWPPYGFFYTTQVCPLIALCFLTILFLKKFP